MPKIEAHPPGNFCWMELGTSDQNAAKSFYSSLFGWTHMDFPMGPGETYTIFGLDGADSAAAYYLNPQRFTGVPPHWMVYIAVKSADEAVNIIREAGGSIMAGPFDVGESGRMAVATDPTGAHFCVWEAKSNKGIGVVGEAGAFCWADLSTADPAKAAEFYSKAFGWKIATAPNDPSGYLHIQNGEPYIGGIQAVSMRNPNAPPHWLTYFQIADCDAGVGKLKDLGGTVLAGPMSIPDTGRFAVVTDPQGAVFALFEPPHGS